MRNPTLKYYSQNGEDYILWEFFDYIRTGFYIDIGAFDGIYLSNTYSFEKQGWEGICVEPHPDYFSLLKKNRPNSKCLNYACVGNRNQINIDFQTEQLGFLSSLLNTDEYVNDIKSRYKKKGLEFEGLKTIKIPAASLDELLENHLKSKPDIDFITIDVEGTEIEVLKGFNLGKYSPRVIIIEGNNDAARKKIINYLANESEYLFAGYLIENVYFVREKADLEKIREIEIECQIEKQIHPLGITFSIPGYLNGKVINKEKKNKLLWKLD